MPAGRAGVRLLRIDNRRDQESGGSWMALILLKACSAVASGLPLHAPKRSELFSNALCRCAETSWGVAHAVLF